MILRCIDGALLSLNGLSTVDIVERKITKNNSVYLLKILACVK